MNADGGKPAAIVSLQHVDARIGRQLVLRDVSLAVHRGEHLGIIGANGSGKTTLLRLLAGTHWPAPGRGRRVYRFDGRCQRDAVEARKRITLVGPELQDTYVRLDWNFTAAAVVVTGLHGTEIPRRATSASERRRAQALLDRLDARHLSDRPFLELSRGEQRRVLIARALACEAELLLLDEPGSGLDTAARAELDRAISRAADQTTIAATAHQVSGLPSMVRRVVATRDQTVVSVNPAQRPASHTSIAAALSSEHTTQAADSPDPDSPDLVVLRNATVWIGERCVLRNINWRLRAGVSWLVTGANGAGKSTFLRLLHGQIRPARGGTIEWPAFGNPRNIWDLRRGIGWASPELQADYRYPTTVAQCIASGFHSSVGQTRRLDPAQTQRRDELLAGFQLEPLRARLLSQLSYGQARRTLLARTLASSPRLLLLDEPWEGLDPEVVTIVLRQLLAAMRRGTQIVCASHIGDAGLGLQNHLVIADNTINERVTA